MLPIQRWLRDLTKTPSTENSNGFRGAHLSALTIKPGELFNFGKHKITLPDFVRLSVSQINELSRDQVESIAQIMLEGAQGRAPARQVANRYQECHAVDRQTALTSVSLQLRRIASFLARQRSLEAGITHFKWRWSGALDENPSHKAREGLVLEWCNPMIEGKPLGIFDLPGMSADCNCRSQSVLGFD